MAIKDKKTKLILLTVAAFTIAHAVAHISVKTVKQKRIAKREQQARINDSLQNTVEYQQALEAYKNLSVEQQKLLQKESTITK